MKKLIALLIALPLLGGCVAMHRAQLEGKIPKIDASEVRIDVSTIYGVSGTLTETNVTWSGDTKSVGSSELRITSPAGTYHRTIRGVVAKP